jgi:hypothetical protein
MIKGRSQAIVSLVNRLTRMNKIRVHSTGSQLRSSFGPSSFIVRHVTRSFVGDAQYLASLEFHGGWFICFSN